MTAREHVHKHADVDIHVAKQWQLLEMQANYILGPYTKLLGQVYMHSNMNNWPARQCSYCMHKAQNAVRNVPLQNIDKGKHL
jgi:hypothetical protein